MQAGWTVVALVLAGCVAEPSATLEDVRIRLEHLADVTQPVELLEHDGRLYVAEQVGKVRLLTCSGTTRPCPVETVLDLGRRVATGGERGLLGLAMGPDSRIYVHYSGAPDGRTVVSRFLGPVEDVLVEIPQPYSNHNGGKIAFGPDGMLYVGLGDGGGAGDPDGRAADPNDPLGKILRLDVSGLQAQAPADNPFVGRPGDDRVWALGLRNPWRFAFDDVGPGATGDLWIADVGQNRFEEVNHVPAPLAGGLDFGWDAYEGNDRHEGDRSRAGLVFPVFTYGREDGRSITGGYVHRGSMSALSGAYLFGDYATGRIWAFADGEAHQLLDTSLAISGFGRDAAGDTYVLDHRGAVYKLHQDAR